MQRPNRSPKQTATMLVTLFIVLSILLAFAPVQSTQAATQYLGGYARNDDLKIQVLDDGRIGVERWTGSTWERQIYSVTSKGSRLQYSGGSVGLGYFSGGSKTTLYNTSSSTGSAGSRTWTADTKWTGGGFDIVQKVTYREGDPYFKLQWNITNTSGGTKSDLRFFHGEDTYLRNGDNGAGWVDWDNNTIGVKKNVGTEQRMSLQGITTPFAYQSNNYGLIGSAVNSGALSKIVDPNERTDNGYALEWRNGSLGNGSTWSITAYEKFNNVTISSVQIIAPVAADCNKGATCNLVYTVKNTGGSPTTVGLAVTTENSSWGYTVSGSTSPTIAAGGTAQLTVAVTVPSDAPGGSSMDVKLTATPSSGSATSETASVNALTPPNSAPSSVSLSGTQSFSENNGSNQSMGTLSGSDPDGDALSFSLMGADAGSFTLSGTTLRNNASFNYETKQSYSITVRASDGKGGTRDQAFTISVTNLNEAPTLAQPAAQSVNEDAVLNLIMTAADPDGQTGRLSWSILQNPTHGTASASGTGGSKTVTYTPSLNYNGPDSFQVRVTGEGGTTSDQTVNVTVNAVNDGPANSWNGGAAFGSLQLRVNQSITFDDGGIAHIPNRITVSDVDGSDFNFQVTLTVGKGSLALNPAAGVSSGADLNGADGSLSFTGNTATVNAGLKGLTYTPNSGYSGGDTLTITVNDQGSTGSGGAKSDTDTLSITIANPATFTVDDGFSGNVTAGWGYERFTRIEDALTAAQGADATNSGDPKPALTVAVQGGSYPSDSIVLNNARTTLRLDGPISLGKDFTITAGTFDPNLQKLIFITGDNNQTHHLLSGAPTFADLEVANANTLELAPDTNPGFMGELILNGALDAIAADPGRTTVTLAGAGAQTLPSGLTLDNLVVGGGTTFNAPAALTLQGSLTNLNVYNGGSSSLLTFAGPAGRTQQISGNPAQFNNLLIGANATLQPSVDFSVNGSWTDNGTFNANGREVTFNGTTIFGGETVFHDITVDSGGSLSLAAGADFGYSGAFTQSGMFNPTTNPNTTVRLAGTGARTLPAGVDQFHHLAVNHGASLNAVNRDLTVRGDLTVNGGFNNTDGSLAFTGGTGHALHIAGGVVPQLGDLILPSGNTLTPDTGAQIQVAGNWDDQGAFNANGGTVTFNGSAQSFTGETVFNHVDITSDAALTLANHADFGYTGVFTNSGSFDPLANPITTLRLAGTGSQTLPDELNSLHHLVVNPGAVLDATGRPLSLRGSLDNQGSLDNRGGSVSFANGTGHTLTVGSGAALNQLGSLDIASSNALTTTCAQNQPVRIAGDWNNAGSFTPNQCVVIFNGSDSQEILGSGNSFYDLTVQNTAAYPNDNTDVDSDTAISVTHTLSVIKGQFQPEHLSTFASVILGGADPSEAGILRPDRGERLIVNGDWERKSYGWFDANAGTLEFTGETAAIQGGATFYNLIVSKETHDTLSNTAPVIVENQLTLEEGVFTPSANSRFKTVVIQDGSELKPAGNINISGHLDNAGTYTHNGKSVTFDGSAVQELTGRVDFYNLTVNSGSTLQMQVNSTLGYEGALVLQGTLDATSYRHNTVEVMGSGFVQSLPAVTVDNLTILSGSSLKLAGNLTVTGDMTVQDTGTLDVNTKLVTFDYWGSGAQPTFRGTATFGAVSVAGDTTLYLKDNANFKFTGSISGGSLDGVTAGSNTTLTAAGSGARTIPSGAKINHLVIQDTAQLSGNGISLEVFGNWTYANSGAFVPGNGTVTFKGDAAQSINAGTQTFNVLVVNKDAGSRLTAGVVATLAALQLPSGEFQPACGSTFNSVDLAGGVLILPDIDGCQVTVNEDLTRTGGSITANGGTLTFDGGLDTLHTLTGNPVSLDGLALGSDDTLTLASGADLRLAGPLSLPDASSLSGNSGSTLTVTGSVTLNKDLSLDDLVITNGASLTTPALVNLTLAGDLSNSGTFDNTGGMLTFNGGSHTLTTDPGDLTQFGDLTITDGDSLIQNGTIQVAGNWLNLGAYTPNSTDNFGTLVFNGSADQTIRSDGVNNNFYNLTIDNSKVSPLGVVASQNNLGAELPLSIAKDLSIRRGQLLVPSGSSLVNVSIEPGAVINLPVGDNSVGVNGHWDNRGQISTGDGASIAEGGSFYLAAAVVDQTFGSVPGLDFDKFTTIGPALLAAEDDVIVIGGADQTFVNYPESITINPTVTTAELQIQGNVQLSGLALTTGTVSLSSGSRLAVGTYTQAGGTFNLGSATFTVSGDFTPAGGTFNSGSGTLGLSGNFAPAADTFNVGTGTVEFNGSAAQTIAAGASFHNLTINNQAGTPSDTIAVLPAGVVTVADTLTVADGQFMPKDESHFLRIVIGAAGTLKLDPAADIYIDPGGSLSRHATGRLLLNGGTIAGLPQSSVEVDNQYDADTSGFGYDRFNTISSALAAIPELGTAHVQTGDYGAQTINRAARIVSIDGLATFTGSLAVTDGALQVANGQTLQTTGSFSVSAPGAFVSGPGTQGTVELNGNSAQVIDGSGLVFYNLKINNTGSAASTSTAAITATNDLLVSDGSFEPACGSSFKNVSVASGAELRLPAGGCSIYVSGDWEIQSGGGFTPNNGTVIFNGVDAQIIGNAVFANLQIASGRLTADAGTLEITGDWTNTGEFIPSGGKVSFTGAGTHTLSGAPLNFHTIEIGAGSTLAPAGDLSLTGNWTQDALGLYTPGGHTVTFNGDGLQTLNGPVGGVTFANLTVQKTGVSKLVVNPAIIVTTRLEIASGELELRTNSTVHTTGNTATAHLAQDAVLTLVGSTNLWVDNWASDGGAVNSDTGALIPGRMDALSVDDDFDTSTPGFGIDRFKTLEDALEAGYLADGGLIGIEEGTYPEDVLVNTKAARLVANGSVTMNNLTIDFAGASFTAPDAAGGKTFTLNGSLAVPTGSFNPNGGTLVLGNSAAHSLSSGLTLHNLTVAAGSTLTAPAALTLRGNLDVAAGATVDAATTAISFAAAPGSNHIFTGSASFAGVSVGAGETLSLSANSNLGLSGSLGLGGASLAASPTSTLSLTGATQTLPSGLTLGSLNISATTNFTAPAALSLSGDLNLTGSGAFTHGGGTVTLLGSAEQDVTGSAITFYNLTIDDADNDTGANAVLAAAAVNVTNTLDIADGRFSPTACGQYGSVTIGAAGEFAPQTNAACSQQVSGSWTNNGLFTAGLSKISFNGSGAQTIGGAHDTVFKHLDLANTSTDPVVPVTLVDGRTAKATGDLTVSAGSFAPPSGSQFENVTIVSGASLEAPAGMLLVGGDWTNNNLTGGFIPGSGSVRFNGAGAHTLTGPTAFTNLEAENGNTITLAAGSNTTISGGLNLNTTGAIAGDPASTLRLYGSGPRTLPTGASLGSLEIGPDVTFNAPASLALGGNLSNLGVFNPGTGTVTFTGSATLSGDVSFNNLVVDNATLTLASDARLTLAGNLTLPNGGDLDGSASGSTFIAAGGGTQTLPGGVELYNLVIQEGTTLEAGGGLTLSGNLTANGDLDNSAGSIAFTGSGTQNITGSGAVRLGDVTLGAGSTLVPGDRNLYVNGDWTNNNPTNGFTPGSGTVTFEGTGTHTLDGTRTTFNNLILSGGTATGPVVVGGNLTVGTGAIFQPATGSDFNNVAIALGGTLAPQAGSTISVGGNWTDQGTFDGSSGGTVSFDGADQLFSGDTRFDNLQIGNGSTLVLNDNADLGYTGTFNFLGSGALDAASHPGTVLTVAGDGSSQQTLPNGLTLNHLVIANGAILDGANTGLILLGNLNAGGNILNGLSVGFAGDSTQNITGGGEVHLGDVTIGENSTLVPGSSLYVRGDWTNHNPAGGFTPGSGTVTFEGAGAQVIGGETVTAFTDLVIAGGLVSGPVIVTDDLTVDDGAVFEPANGSDFNNVTIAGGTLTPDEGATISVAGNWIDNGSSPAGFNPNLGTVVFDGAGNQSIGGSNSPAHFNNLVVANGDNNTLTPAIPLDVDGDLRLEDGAGTLIVPDSSEFNNVTINPGSNLQLDLNAQFSLDGNWSNQGTYDANGGGLDPTSSPDISAALVDPVTCNATPGACGVDRFATIQAAIDAVTNPGTDPDTGTVTILQGTYGIPGEDTLSIPANTSILVEFQNDATPENDSFTILGNIVQSSGSIVTPRGTLTLGGNLTHNAGEFYASFGTVIFDGEPTQTISGLETTFFNLTLNDGDLDPATNSLDGEAEVNVSGALHVTDGTYRPAQCGQYGSIEIGAKGVFEPQSGTACIRVSGNWDNDGVFNVNGAPVTFNGSAGQTIGGANNTAFAGLTIDNTGTTGAVTLIDGRSLSVAGDLSIMDGRFEPSNGSSFQAVTIGADGALQPALVSTEPVVGAQIDIAGTLTNQGTFTANSSTVRLNGSAGQALEGALAFYNLTVEQDESTDLVDANGPIRVTNTLTLYRGVLQFPAGSDFNDLTVDTDGTLSPDLGATFSISGNWDNHGTYNSNEDTVVFDGSGAQAVEGVGGFYNLTVSNTAAPEPACTNNADCNAFYDAHAVTFDQPITVTNLTTLTDGQFSPMAGSSFQYVNIDPQGRLRAELDGDGLTTNDFIEVTGRLSNRGVFDLNELEPRGDFVIDQLYVSSQYSSSLTPGYDVDHFDTIAAALQKVVVPDTTITIYGGAYAGNASFTDINMTGLDIQMVSTSAIDQSILAVSIAGSLTLNDAGVTLIAPDGELQIGGGFTLGAGTFVPGTGKVVFNGSLEQHIRGAVPFYDLEIANTADPAGDTADVDSDTAISVTHELRVSDGQFSPLPCQTFTNVVIGTNGILKPQAGTQSCASGLRITGSWTNSGGSFAPNGSLVTFNGAGAQTISGETGFDNLVIDNPLSVSVTGNFAAGGDLTLVDGTLTLPDNASIHDLVIQTGAQLDLAPGADLSITGNWDDQTANGGFTANAGTVHFAGTGNQTFTGSTTFHNLEVGGASTLILGENAELGYSGGFNLLTGGHLDADDLTTTLILVHTADSPATQYLPGPGSMTLNNLVIDPGVTLNGGSQDLTLLGDFTNSGTFQGGSGEVIFDGPDGQTQTLTGSGTNQFNDLTVSGTLDNTGQPANVGGTLNVTPGGDYTPATGSVLHDVVIQDGATLDGSNASFSVTGDWTNADTDTTPGGGFTPGTGTVTFNGTGPEDQNLTGPTDFNQLVIDTDDTVNVNDPLNVTGALTVTDGEFVQVQSGSFFDTIVIGPQGTLVAEDGATDINTNHLEIETGGTFSTPGGVFRPSNILWADDETRTTLLPEKPVGLDAGLLMTVDLNLEPQNQFSYALVSDEDACPNNDNSFFTLQSQDGLTHVVSAKALDFETHPGAYTLCLQTSDPTQPSGLSVIKTLTVTPTDANDEPVVAEDAADGQSNNQASVAVWEDRNVEFTLHGSDQDRDAQNGQRDTLTWAITVQPIHGTLSVPQTLTGNDLALSYEPSNDNWNGQDSFSVRITDGMGGVTNLLVRLDVQAENDPPINEVPPVVSPSNQAVIGQKVQVTSGEWNDSTDSEGPGAISVTYQWQRADDDQGANAADIPGAVESAYYPTAADQGSHIRVRVTAHDNGRGQPASAETTLDSAWLPVPGGTPNGIHLTHTTVAENMPAGIIVGYLSATDPDAGDVFTYELVDGNGPNDNTQFTIQGSALKTNAQFDFAVKPAYTVHIRVTDGGGHAFAEDLEITVVGRQADIQPNSEAIINYAGTELTPTGTNIHVPYGAVLDPMTMIFTPRDTVENAPAGLAFASHGFDLSAIVGGVEDKDYEFTGPVTVTLTYPDEAIPNINEDTLRLNIWTGSAWEDASCGVTTANPEENTLTLQICRLGEFGLFGEQYYMIYFPIISNSGG